MKIPLKFIDGRLILSVAITSSHYHFGVKKIIFIIDTGSDATFVGHNDALTLQIPQDSLKFKEYFRMAAASYGMYLGRSAGLYLRTDENKLYKIELKELSIGLSNKKGNKRENEMDAMPSIMGTDFLKSNGFSLYFNPAKDEAYLEK